MRLVTCERSARPAPHVARVLQCSALPATGPGALSLLGGATAATALSAACPPKTWPKSGQAAGRGWPALGKSFSSLGRALASS
eukprot:9190972-Alexandrium_andersonii.AAC.1